MTDMELWDGDMGWKWLILRGTEAVASIRREPGAHGPNGKQR